MNWQNIKALKNIFRGWKHLSNIQLSQLVKAKPVSRRCSIKRKFLMADRAVKSRCSSIASHFFAADSISCSSNRNTVKQFLCSRRAVFKNTSPKIQGSLSKF